MDIDNDYNSDNIIKMDEHRFKRLIDTSANIREFGDRYEYCLINEYEDRYDSFTCDSIELDEISVQILTVRGEHKLVSIDFSKKIFDIEDIPNYLNLYGVKMLKKGENKINGAFEIIKGLKFKGSPIVFYEKGNDTINIDRNELEEITDSYLNSEFRVNTFSSKIKKSIISELKIFLDNEEVHFIPEIEIDLTKDLIITNGHIMKASYIGNYNGSVGFFEKQNDPSPISWIHDKDTIVYIDIYQQSERKIIIVEHNYAIDLEELQFK